MRGAHAEDGRGGVPVQSALEAELVDAIRVAARGTRYVTAEAAEALEASGDRNESAPHERLSAREHQVFLLVVEGRTPGDIAAQLNLSPSTVSSHPLHIREKLGARTNGEILKYAYRPALTGGT